MRIKLRFAAVIAMTAGALALSACGQSAEDKAAIRLAVSAFSRADNASPGDAHTQRLMDDLQKAIDVVPDGNARTEILDCYALLKRYKLVIASTAVSYETNLKNTTEAEAQKAMAEAQLAHPLPDLKPLFDCRYVRLPKVAR